MQEGVFGNAAGPDPEDLARRITASPELHEHWIATDPDGQVVCAGRLDMVPGTEFGGLWGGSTVPAWRGRGIYRALVAARAESLELGVRAATALVASVGGRAMASVHPAQRLLREAVFFTIQAQTPALRRATLAQLVSRRT